MSPELETVKKLFSYFSGEDPEDETARGALCLHLCEESVAPFADCDLPEKAVAAVESWCAAQAFYQLALVDEAAVPESISAEGVRLELAGTAEKARLLRDEKRRIARRLLGEGEFYFGST